MILARTVTVLAVSAALGLAVLPAHADQRRGRGGQGGQGGARAAQPANPSGGEGTVRRAVPRGAAPPGTVPAVPAGAPRGASRPDSYVTLPGRVSPQWGYQAPRGGYPSRSWGSRPWGSPSYYGGYGGYAGYRPGPVFYGSRGWYPYRSYGPRHWYPQAYYKFRPRLSVGFGLWVGFPVPFPAFGLGVSYPYPAYGYPAPYPVPYPVPYPAPAPAPPPPAQAPSGSVAVTPIDYGGVSLEITPEDAEVWVDGAFAGRANEFSPNQQPLTLTIGVHRVELRAPGHRSLTFDVTIAAGQVVPYQGRLQPGP